MQYGTPDEKTNMMDTAYSPVPQPVSMNKDPQVQRTRKILLIIVGICLALTVLGFIGALSNTIGQRNNKENQPAMQIGQCLLSILFYGLGFFAAYRYSAIGLQVFAWLAIIDLVILGILIILCLVAGIWILIASNYASNDSTKGYEILLSTVSFIFIVVCVGIFILTLIIVKLSFRLARLIDSNQHMGTQQV